MSPLVSFIYALNLQSIPIKRSRARASQRDSIGDSIDMFSSARDELARQTDVERTEPIVIDADADDAEARKRAR